MRRVVFLSLIITVDPAASLGSGHHRPGRQQHTDCTAMYTAAITDMMQYCFAKEPGMACGASGDVSIEMVSGQTVQGAGITAKVSGVFALRTRPGDGSQWSLASLTLPDMVDPQKSTTLLDARPGGTRIPDRRQLNTRRGRFPSPVPPNPLCSDLPRPGVLVQSAENSLTLLNDQRR